MREYKFRVWDSSINEYLKTDQDNPYLYCKLGISYNLSDVMFFYAQSKNNRWIVQQFTGLTDKNNKEICEGDILKIDYDTFGNVIGQVIYQVDQGAYIFQWKRNGPNQNYINLNCDVAFESVIVGNIFENPELLK
jgi:uncharacterized phage protein (TIGR01671 family)